MKHRIAALFCLCALLGALSMVPLGSTYAQAAPAVPTSAASMAVIEAGSGRVLYEKDGETKRPMASTTKICTAITVLEHCDDLEKAVVVPDAAVGVEGSSIYLQKGEKVKIIDLLYGLMLRSGNDCATALAILTAGSVDQFADLMNETAQKAGAENTHFVNPHGLHDDNHYTTALDLAKITAYAFKNETFAKIVATKTHSMSYADYPYPRTMQNKNKILFTYEGGDGVKTGYTKKAGRCLVASATRKGMRVIAVVLNCGPMFEDCAALMDKAFEEYALFCPIEKPVETKVAVENGKEASVPVASKDTFSYPIKAGEEEDFCITANPVSSLAAPVQRGCAAGEFTITFKNQLLFSGKLYTIKEVPARDYLDHLEELIDAW